MGNNFLIAGMEKDRINYHGGIFAGIEVEPQHRDYKLRKDDMGDKLRFSNGCKDHVDCFTCPEPDCIWSGTSKNLKRNGKITMMVIK